MFRTFIQTKGKCARFDANQDGYTNFINNHGKTKQKTNDNDSNHNTIPFH